MPRYNVPFEKTGIENVQQLVEILSSATVQRTMWYMFTVSFTGTLSDGLFQYSVKRVTGSATGTGVTPSPKDLQDAASRATAEHLITADHASFAAGTVLWRFTNHRRANYTWQTADKPMTGPATSANGLSLGLNAASTLTFDGTIEFEE